MVLPEMSEFVRQDIGQGFGVGIEGDPLALVLQILIHSTSGFGTRSDYTAAERARSQHNKPDRQSVGD